MIKIPAVDFEKLSKSLEKNNKKEGFSYTQSFTQTTHKDGSSLTSQCFDDVCTYKKCNPSGECTETTGSFNDWLSSFNG